MPVHGPEGPPSAASGVVSGAVSGVSSVCVVVSGLVGSGLGSGPGGSGPGGSGARVGSLPDGSVFVVVSLDWLGSFPTDSATVSLLGVVEQASNANVLTHMAKTTAMKEHTRKNAVGLAFSVVVGLEGSGVWVLMTLFPFNYARTTL